MNKYTCDMCGFTFEKHKSMKEVMCTACGHMLQIDVNKYGRQGSYYWNGKWLKK